MLRPIAALGPSLGLMLGLLAAPAAQAQSPSPRGDCVSSGLVQLGAFTARPVVEDRGGETNVTEYAVGLRATRPLRMVMVTFRLGTANALNREVELPVGQEVRVVLGRRGGARLSDTDLRAGLHVLCTPE